MNKKIDFFNRNNKNLSNRKDKIQNMKKTKQNTGSKFKPLKTNPSSIPKRRGRRPKKILENINTGTDNPSDDIANNNNSAVILRLNIDPSKLKNIKNNKNNKNRKNNKNNKEKNIEQNYDNEESSEGMFKNDIPTDNICHKCAKNEKALMLLKSKLNKYEKKEKIDKTNKIYSNKLKFISSTTGKKIIIKKTNIKCWWDAHNFTNLPCFLPELYHNNTYHVMGCFCSFNCALAYNLYFIKDSKIHHRKSLIYKLYREMYGLTTDDIIEIKEAPPKEILADFGGDMSIDVFRRSFFMINKEYIVFIPPIKPINITIEERNTDVADEDNDKEYVLKRSKPLAKKRSVISSMKIQCETMKKSQI